jgi:hypothetical protein
MGVFNFLQIPLICPHCSATFDAAVHLTCGARRGADYSIGDVYDWCEHEPVERGGRPIDGTIDDLSFVICRNCDQYFGVTTIIRHDVIKDVNNITTHLPWESKITPEPQSQEET